MEPVKELKPTYQGILEIFEIKKKSVANIFFFSIQKKKITDKVRV